MRDFIKLLIVGVVIFFAPQVFAESYKVLIVPDNVVTDDIAVDSYIYDASAEFFADGVISILNATDFIDSQPVSQTRAMLKSDPSAMLSAKNLTYRFKNSYNVDFAAVKKLANKAGVRYVLLLTSSIDAENYILRRTFWDFLNIAGATVVDPAYKICTYAVLVDTSNNTKVWSDTYYKTISACENRIITRGPSPQLVQLEKIKDYSRYLCPQIAENVQVSILPPDVYAKESQQVYYDMGNIDNVFTKKYRHLGKEYDKVYAQKKAQMEDFTENTKAHIEENKQIRAQRKAKKAAEQTKQQTELKVKATPVYKEEGVSGISFFKRQSEPSPVVKYVDDINTKPVTSDMITPAYYYKENTINNVVNINNQNINNDLDGIDLNLKKRKNNLFRSYQLDQPELRDYSK